MSCESGYDAHQQIYRLTNIDDCAFFVEGQPWPPLSAYPEPRSAGAPSPALCCGVACGTDGGSMQMVMVPMVMSPGPAGTTMCVTTAGAQAGLQCGEGAVVPSLGEDFVLQHPQDPWRCQPWVPAAEGLRQGCDGHSLNASSTCYSSEAACSVASQEENWAGKHEAPSHLVEDLATSTGDLARVLLEVSAFGQPRPRKPSRRKGLDPAPVVPLQVQAAGAQAPVGRPAARTPLGSVPLGDGDSVLPSDGEVRGRVARLAFDAAGCRVVQKTLLEASTLEEAAELAGELRGRVREAVESPHANHVLQRIIEVLPCPLRRFVSEELRGAGVQASRHRYGCRVICRFLEHQHSDEARTSGAEAALLEEIVEGLSCVLRHEFGRHVACSILEHSSDDHRARVAALLAENPLSHAMNRNASYVVERALEFCDHEGRAMIAGPLLADPGVLLKLSQSQAGSHVVRGLVRPGQGTWQRVLEDLRRLAPELQASKYAKPLLRELRSHVEARPPLGSA